MRTPLCFPMARGAAAPQSRSIRAILLSATLACAIPAIVRAQDTSTPANPPTANPAPQAPSTDVNTPQTADLPGEMRGMWVVRDSLVSRASIHQIVVTAVKYHFNALFVQVRGRGDAFYNTPYEPRAELLAGTPQSFDPLKQVVEEAHANGLQVHAWMNTFLTWSGARRPSSPEHLWNAHRDWFARDRHGRCSPVPTNACEGVFLQPSNPAVQQHLFDVYTYVASNYDVDGIHFDYCRYAGSEYDFSPATVARFRAYIMEQKPPDEIEALDRRLAKDPLIYVHAYGGAWADWRRAQITNLIARISAAVKAEKPWMQVSAAVFPDADDAFVERGQDWRGWLKAGYLDAVALMSYNRNTGRVLAQTRRAIAAAGAEHIFAGIGAWQLSAHDVAAKITAVRKTGAAGVNLFSYNGMHERSHYLDTLARGVFASRAAPPRMRWLPDRSASAGRAAFPTEPKAEDAPPPPQP